MDNNYTVVAASADMAAQIAEILQETGWFNVVELGRIDQALSQRRDDIHRVLTAQQQDGVVIGYIAYHLLPYLFLAGDEAYVSELFVRDTERGRGVGAALMDAAQREAKARGAVRMMLVTGRNRESYRREFYKKRGWREREQIANFILTFE